MAAGGSVLGGLSVSSGERGEDGEAGLPGRRARALRRFLEDLGYLSLARSRCWLLEHLARSGSANLKARPVEGRRGAAGPRKAQEVALAVIALVGRARGAPANTPPHLETSAALTACDIHQGGRPPPPAPLVQISEAKCVRSPMAGLV